MCRAGEVTDERGARDDAPCTWTRDDDQKTPDMHTIEDSATHEEKRRRMKLTTIDLEDLQMQEKSSIPQPSLPRPGGMESDELNCAKKQPKSALEKGRHALRAAEDATAPCVEDLKADPSGPVAVDASQEADSAMAGSRIGGKEVKMEDYSEEPKPYSGESTGRAAATETCIPRLYSDGIPRMYSDGQCNGSTGSTEYGAFPLILDVSAIPVVEEGALDDDAWSETGASAAEGLASAMASPQGAGKGCAACLGRHRPHTCGRGLSLSVSKTSGSARRKGAGTTAAVNANAAYALPKRTGSSSPKRSSIPTTAHTAEDNSSVGSTSPVQKPRASTPRKPPPPAATQGQGAPTARKGWYRREGTPDSSTVRAQALTVQVLRAISDGGLLNNYAAKAPANWKALHSLTQLAVECSFAEEARFRLLVNPLELRHLLAAVEPAANKLCRLLQAGGDAMLGMAMDNSIAGIHLESRKTRLERKQSWEEDAKQVELVRIVRIRFHNKMLVRIVHLAIGKADTQDAAEVDAPPNMRG
ncbi:hypothetical protein AB1Y20_007230 [Prymnesium parvum]|uniref:Uncharacterized protein n=1 Tax=Prymnesium parvum TaxID=97485 RepID=A0AB34IU85_PRYPA